MKKVSLQILHVVLLQLYDVPQKVKICRQIKGSVFAGFQEKGRGLLEAQGILEAVKCSLWHISWIHELIELSKPTELCTTKNKP